MFTYTHQSETYSRFFKKRLNVLLCNLKRPVWKSYALVNTFLFFTLLFSGGRALAQFNCPDESSCVSKDLEVIGAFVEGADECTTCEPGDTITRKLFFSIANKTGSERPAFALFGTISGTIDPEPGEISFCVGPIPPMDTLTKEAGTIKFVCGTELKLTDVFLAWSDASGTTEERCLEILEDSCESIAPKCGTADEIIIKTALAVKEVEHTNPCGDAEEGCITFEATGGTPPYSYTLSGGTLTNPVTNSTGVFCDLGAGDYDISVEDDKECTATNSFTLESNSIPGLPTLETTQPTCTVLKGCLKVIGLLQGFTVSLDDLPFGSITEFCDLSPGEHCIRVKSAAGCISAKACRTINETPEPPGPPTLRVRQPTCTRSTGCLIVTSPTGEGYSYSIDEGQFQTSPRFCGLLPGEHCIRVKIGNCISDPTCETIDNVPEKPTCYIIPPDKKPIAKSTGNKLCANASAGVVTYKWTIQGTGWTITGGQGTSCITYTAGAAGSSAKFTLKVTDENGCYSKCTITIRCIRRTQISSEVSENRESVMTSGKPFLKAYPNPFRSEVNFNVISPVSGKAILEIYDLVGRKLALVYNGNVDAGASYTFKYKAPVAGQATLVYKLTIGRQTYHGILIPAQ